MIAWTDFREPVNANIVAQAVTIDGTIRWFPNGMPTCTAAGYQTDALIIPDGSGGSIVAWQDARGSTSDIYAQKLGMFPLIQWAGNGVTICTGQSGLILGGMISDGAGGAIITWQDKRDFYNGIFAQRIASNGTVSWTANGVEVCSEVNHQQAPALAPDGSGGAIIAWEDDRNDNYDIYAQRLNASGAAQWTAGGIPICDSGQNQTAVQVVEDGSGGAVFAWSDRRSFVDNDIYAQRVNASGAPQWTAGGTPVGAWMQDQSNCQLVHIGSGETIVTWLDNRNGATTDIYTQKLNGSGAGQWAYAGIVVCTATGNQDNVRIVTNGVGGAFIAWDDERNGTSNVDIYAQNVGSGGTPAWTANGLEICGAAGNQTEVAICEDQANGMFIAWGDARSGTVKVYSHRVDANGDIPAATLLSNYTADVINGDIRIDWTLSEIDEGVEFHIFRANGLGNQFVEIPAAGLVEDDLTFSFVDRNCKPGTSYNYRVSYDFENERYTLFEVGPITTPATVLGLHQNLPNPFNPNTSIGYYVPEQSRVQLEVYDVKGSLVTVLVDRFQAEGTHQVYWNGRYSNGTDIAR